MSILSGVLNDCHLILLALLCMKSQQKTSWLCKNGLGCIMFFVCPGPNTYFDLGLQIAFVSRPYCYSQNHLCKFLIVIWERMEFCVGII
jgi:hypothetical protein